MGAGKRRIPIARIPDLQARRVCFAKRRNGFFRKCLERCELFPGCQVAAVAFSPDVGNPFAFAAPAHSASPADLFSRFLSHPDLLPALGTHAVDSEEGSTTSVSINGSSSGGSDIVEGSAGWTVEGDGVQQCCFSGVSSSAPSLDDKVMQLLPTEEERAELAAILQWVDGVFAFGDGPEAADEILA